MKRIPVLSLSCLLMLSHYAHSQVMINLPILPPVTTPTGVHVPDGGLVRHNSAPRKSSREIIASTKAMDQQCSKTVVDGLITYDIIHDGKPLKLLLRPNGTIEMTIVRLFDIRNADELGTSHPLLAARFKEFPSKIGDNSRVRVNLEIETTHSFASASELEERRPDLYRIYNQHARPPIIERVK